jgi:tetratricopeptide (TPR) repeat protein
MPDEVRLLSAQLAQDPQSLVFLRLGELLRRRGQLDASHRVALAGLERHPHNADAHDLYARILADKHDYERAFDEWDMALRVAPNHMGALKGLAFLYFKIGDIAQAEAHLFEAQQVAPDDASVSQALALVRGAAGSPAPASLSPPPAGDVEAARPRAVPKPPPAPRPPPAPQPPPALTTPPVAEPAADLVTEPAAAAAPAPAAPSPPPPGPRPRAAPEPVAARGAGAPLEQERVFAGLEGADEGLLLLDGAGRALGGAIRDPEGRDATEAVAAYLAGVSQEAARTAKLLGLGRWTGLSAEGRAGHVHLSLPRADAMLLVVRDRAVPLGRLAVLAERAAAHARIWLEREL